MFEYLKAKHQPKKRIFGLFAGQWERELRLSLGDPPSDQLEDFPV